MKAKFNVYGWLNGSDYDAGKNADHVVKVVAENESDAEERGDRELKKTIGNCDIVIAYLA